MSYYYTNFPYNDRTQFEVVEETLRPFAMSIFPIGFHGVSCVFFFPYKQLISFFFLQFTCYNIMNAAIPTIASSKCRSRLDVKCYPFYSSGYCCWRSLKSFWDTKFRNVLSSCWKWYCNGLSKCWFIEETTT